MGRLVVYLGAAAGVGKTYAMLGEARLAVQDGVDLVVGYLEPHGRPATEERARGLERAPLVRAGPGGRAGTEMDVPWLLERRPSVVLVDELAHTYAVGDPPRRRHQDVAELRRRGIEVWTTLNVQHLESLSDRVAALTGTTVRETVPDGLVHGADEVRLVDLSPSALRERIERGFVYPAERVEQALTGFFTVSHLAGLRALVLHELAEVAAAQYAAVTGERIPEGTERVVAAALGGAADDGHLLREAARMARRLDGDLVVLLFGRARDRRGRDRARLDRLAELAESLGATGLRRVTDQPMDALVQDVADLAATRLVLPSPGRSGVLPSRRMAALRRVLHELPGVDVTLVADRPPPPMP